MSVFKFYLDTTREAELVNSLQSHDPKPPDSGRNLTAKQKICIEAETIAVKVCFSTPWDCQDLSPGKVLQLHQPKVCDNLPLWMTVIACWQLQGLHSWPGNKLWVLHYMFAAFLKLRCSLVYSTQFTNCRAATMVGILWFHEDEGRLHAPQVWVHHPHDRAVAKQSLTWVDMKKKY